MSDGGARRADLPRVSIAILNWNGRGQLAACLDSLLALDYPEDQLELIVCDNGSEDGSVQMVREQYPSLRLVELDMNYGFAEGNNRAAAAATGDWVGFLNNDMVVPPSWVREMVAPLAENPNIACVSSKIVNWKDTQIDFIGGGINFQGHGLQLDYRMPSSPHDKPRRILFPCGGAMLVKRELFLEVGGFDASYFAFFEDIDLGWRLNLLGYDVWYTPSAPVRHKHHGTASRFTDYQLKLLSERNALFTIFKNYDDANLNRVLPVAMLLLNEKATLMAGVDVAAFRPPRTKRPAVPLYDRPASANGGVSQKVWRVLHEEGLSGLTTKTGKKLAKGSRGLLARVRPPAASAYQPPLNTHVVPNIAISHLVAMNELGHHLGELLDKRRWVQERRTRDDDEVLALGGVLLEDPTFGPKDYGDFANWLREVTGINARFERLKL